MKQNLVGEGFLKPLAEDRIFSVSLDLIFETPSIISPGIRVNIIGEIATAENFDEGNL